MKKPEYKISNVDQMDPFLMSLTSSDNHWMFISSNGALTAGREKADYSLFPYITDNLIHSSLNTTGPTTTIEIYKNNKYVKTLTPEKRMYNANKQVTTEAAIHSTVFGDLYIAIGDGNTLSKNSWTTRIWFNSFTIWIWIGVLFLVLGGMLSIFRFIKANK